MLLALGVPAAEARSKKLVGIDEYCRKARTQFVETTPALFGGPNPWIALDNVPSRLLEGMLAYVYTEGLQTRWVVLLIEGPNHRWSETVNYFFGSDNRLVKRERYLEQPEANTALEEFLYYQGGELLSENTTHSALAAGPERSDSFDDPDAPEFLSTSDLPFPADGEGLGTQRLVEIPNQVFDVFETDRKANQLRGDTGSRLFRLRQLLVRSGGRVDDQASRVADVGEVREDFQRVDELLPCLVAAFDAE